MTKQIDNWFKSPIVRSSICDNDGSEGVIVSDKTINICFLKRDFKSSSNLIALPGYDVISLNDSSLLDRHLKNLKSLTKEHTAILAPFQIIDCPATRGILNENQNVIFRNDSFKIDCRLPLDLLISAVSKRKRVEVKNFLNSDIKFKINDEFAKKQFYDLYAHSVDTLNIKAGGVFSRTQVSAFIEMPSTYIASAELDGKTRLAHLIGVDKGRKRAEFVLSGFECDEGREASAKLIWFSINYLKSIGVEEYHLGGGIFPGDGVENFKRQLGGQRLINFCVKIVNNYDIYNRCLSLISEGADIKNKFPSYLHID